MKGPQLEDGYTRIANEILEVVSKVKLNGTQFKIIMAIWRYTYGFNRKDSEFSLGFLAEAINSNKQQVKRELDKLIEDNVITVVKEAGFNASRRLGFNKNYTEWKVKGIQNIRKDTVSELEYSTVSEKAYTTVSGLEYQERQYKDNIKKDTTNNIAKQEIKTRNNNPVADIGADPIQQDNPLQQIERHYFLKVKRRCNGKDFNDIYKTYQKYKDLDFILKVIDIAVERNIKTHGKLTIKSFSYFEQIFEEEWNRKQIKKEVVKNGPNPRNSRKGFKFDKSQFLWNGEEN